MTAPANMQQAVDEAARKARRDRLPLYRHLSDRAAHELADRAAREKAQ